MFMSRIWLLLVLCWVVVLLRVNHKLQYMSILTDHIVARVSVHNAAPLAIDPVFKQELMKRGHCLSCSHLRGLPGDA